MNQYKPEEYLYPEKIAWSEIFEDLKEHDVRPSKIANLIGIAESSLQRLRQGVEPRYSIGRSILELHTRYCSS